MTYKAFYQSIGIPPIYQNVKTSSPNVGTTTINSNGEWAGCIFMAHVSETISHVNFKVGSAGVTGDADIRLETVGADGKPTGTLLAVGAQVTQEILSTDDNTRFEVAIGTPPSVTRGDLIAIVIVADSTLNCGIQNWFDDMGNAGMPYAVRAIPTAVHITGQRPGIIPKYGTSNYIAMYGFIPFTTLTNVSFDNASTPDVIGNAITPTVDCKVDALWVYGDFDGDFKLHLLDTDGDATAALATITIDADTPPVTASSGGVYPLTSQITLSQGSQYFVVVEPTTTTNLTVTKYAFDSNALKNVWAGFNDVSYATAKDPDEIGDWTLDTASVSLMGIVITDLQTDAGGGGGTTPAKSHMGNLGGGISA